MAIGEADSKEHRLRGLLSQPNEKGKFSLLAYGELGEAELRPPTRQVSLAPYDLFSTLSDFSFSMPGGWNDQDLAIFLESCWENIEDLRKQKVDDNTKWKYIADAGARKSLNPTLFTINSCMEVAQCIKSYIIYNEKRLSNNESFKKFHNDVINLLPYFPPATIIGTLSTMNRSITQPVASIAELVNGDDVLENTLSQLILQNMSVIREGSPSIWEKLSQTVHDRIAFSTDVQLFLELTKRKIISLVRKEDDPQRKKEVFFQKAKKYMIEVFDYIAPLSVRKSDFLSPIDNVSLEDSNGDNLSIRKRGTTENPEGAISNNSLCIEGEDTSLHVITGNIPPKKLKNNCESEREDEICEPNKPKNCEKEFHTNQTLEQTDISSSLTSTCKVENNHEKELIESDGKAQHNVLQEAQRPSEEPLVSPLKETVVSSLEEAIIKSSEELVDTPSKESVFNHIEVSKKASPVQKHRNVKKKEKLTPTRVLPLRTARPKVGMKIKHKYKSNRLTERNNKADGMQTKEIEEVNTKNRHERKEIPRPSESVLNRMTEHEERETSVRVVQEVTTTRETILRTSTTTLSRPDNSAKSPSKPGLHTQTPQNNTSFVNERIVTEEKVTTVVEASSFLKKKPIVKLIDICKDSNFEWPIQSQCTITTSDMSSNSNGVTVTKFKAEEISVTSMVKRKRNSVVESTKFKGNYSKANPSKSHNRRSNRKKVKPSKSRRISQEMDKSKVFVKTMVKPYIYETGGETSIVEARRSSRNRTGQSLVSDDFQEPSSSNSEQVQESSSNCTLSNPSVVVSNPQHGESNLSPVSKHVQPQHSVAAVGSLVGSSNSPCELSLTMLTKKWDELYRGKNIDMKSLSVEGLFSRHIDHNDDYWFQKYVCDFNTRSAWRFQEMRLDHNIKIQEERKKIERYRNEVLSSLQKDLNSLKNGLEC